MSVQLLTGPCGTGKTRYMYEKMIKDSLEKEHNPIIYLLPEQSNMIAEQDMISLHPLGGTMDISILSFSRLAYQIFDKENVYTGDVLDDYGKSMLIMKVLREHAKELKYYGNMLGKKGFIDEVKSIISEFYQYGVSIATLKDLIDNLSPDTSLYHKISDLIIICTYFEEAMDNSFMVVEKLLSLLADNVEESGLLKEADIYFDGFTGFTPVQYKVIERMMKVCRNMYFSVMIDEQTVDDNSDYKGLFSMGKDTISNLYKIAEKNNIKVLPHIPFGNIYRIENNRELLHLENNIFRYPIREYVGDDSAGNKKDSENLSAVNIVECDDVEDEIVSIARMVKNYVMEKGYRYRDIAVITGDLDDNIEVWNRIMKRMEIPYFTDSNEMLLDNDVARIVVAVIELFEKDFSFDSVFSFLKTGFTDMDYNSICLLENYAMKYGVHGYSRWSKPFKGNMKNLKTINGIRKEFVESLHTLTDVYCKNEAKASDYIMSLYNFVVEYNLGEKLWNQAINYENSGNVRKAMAYRQAYEKFLSVLDRTWDILSDELITRKSLGDILITGISEIRLGVIPSTIDQVVIGDIFRTRVHNVKILFVAGANEGILPKPVKKGGMITDGDRKKLKEFDVILSPDTNESYYIQQFYLYMQMSQTAEKIVLSYRKNDNKGNALNVSFFLKNIIKMFPRKRIIRSMTIRENILPSSKEDMISKLADDISKDRFEDPSIYHLIYNYDNERLNKLIEGYMYMNQPGVLNEHIAKKLYGDRMIHSVSRLENYASCEYQFFLQYGLKIRKPEEYKIENNHIGTILHSVMEYFFKDVKEERITLPVSEELLNKKVEELVGIAAMEISDTIFSSSFRMMHMHEVINRIAKRSVKNLIKQLEMGDMKPEYFEKEFSPEDELSYIHMLLDDNTVMDMRGIVDRVDIKETEDAVYVKIIDYKSGDKDIDFVKITEGKQLQLAVYMSVMIEYLQKKYPKKKIVPTGMYYFQLADKIIDGIDEEKIESERAKQARMKGLVNSDDYCLEVLDHKTGFSVPVSYNKDGGLSSVNTHTMTEKELIAVSRYTREKMIELGNKIIHGQIDMKPQKGDISSPCNYCDYRSVCRFEAGLGGNNYGIGSKLSKEEAKTLIVGDEKTEG